MRKMKYTYDEIQTMFLKNGLILDSESYHNNKEILQCHDLDGYKYQTSVAYILYGNPIKFHKNNPYTIENIKNYLKLNSIDIELLSTMYVNYKTNLQWKCKCGNIFNRSWDLFCQGFQCCEQCSKKNQINAMSTQLQDVISLLNKYNFTLLNKEQLDVCFKASDNNNKIEYEDKDGYRYSNSFVAFKE